jgi:hypothetical protein
MPQMGIMPGEWDWMNRTGVGNPIPTPQLGGGFMNRMNTRIGEWLAPSAEGAVFGLTPEQIAAAQNAARRQFALGLLSNVGSGRPFTAGLAQGLMGAEQSYRGAQNQAFQNAMLKRQVERADAQEKRLAEQEKREQQASDTTSRQLYATTAGKIAAGLGGTKDQSAYWKMVSGMPEVQAALKSYGIDPATITPEALPQIQQQLATAGQVGGPYVKPESLQLKAIVGPDGKPILVPETMAVGQRPYYQGSKGISMTMPDGTVVEIGGDGSVVGPGDLSKPTINSLQETIVNSTSRLDRLNATLSTYNPEFLRAKGILNAGTSKIKDFLGMDVSPEQRKYLDEYSQFTSSAATDLAAFLKEMSGAAVTPQEYARTEKALPSGKELSPTEFEAKAKVATKTISRAIMRANWALKNGIGVKSVEQLAKAMPLEGIDAVYEKRANEIWQQLGGTAEVKAEAIRRANQEFGLAR